MTQVPHFETAICGAGFSGLGAAIRLREEGFRDFVVLERAREVGGTWRDNSYPGCACDVESNLYSFSFAPNPSWSRAYSPQPEILAYLRRCAENYGLLPHIRFEHEVTGARWNDDARCWHITTSRGEISANVLIAAMGPLSEPSIPKLPGLASFAGKVFHSARWDHAYELSGKRVACIGTGASAVQFVPAIQPKVSKLTLFQRTPAWVMPRMDRAVSEREQAIYARLPIAQSVARALIYAQREALVLGFRNPFVMQKLEGLLLGYLDKQVPDPVLRQKLTPKFRMGCKRLLISSDYLPALNKGNVEVVTDAIVEVRPHSVVTSDGKEREVDAIICGTGFQVTDMPFAHHVYGRAGQTLDETWHGSPKAHYGTTVAGFPNLFLLLGPNTGLGHTSVVLMMESQLELLIGALRHMRRTGLTSMEPKAEEQARFVAEVDKKARGTVWTSGGCVSWYIDATGRNSTLWPSFTFSFRRRCRFRAQEYDFSPRGPAATPDVSDESKEFSELSAPGAWGGVGPRRARA